LPEFQQLQDGDTLFPLLARNYLGPGLKGVVVAGIVAAAVSTFDSMGSALSAIFTRDIYARLIVRDGSDNHYVFVTRVATGGVLALGFLYLPLIWRQENMLKAFTTLIPVFVTPLFTIYVLGVLTRVHRSSGTMGLLVGGAFGVVALIDREVADVEWIPSLLSDRWMTLCWSAGLTGLTMALVTWFRGAEPRDREVTFSESGWLDRSREQLPPLKESPFDTSLPWWGHPTIWAAVLVALCTWIVFGPLW
jgi:SSS family solute:Na+ symporter